MRALIYLLIAGNLLALFVGITMFMAQDKLRAWFGSWAGWITLRRVTKSIDVPRDTDQALLRYPRVLGAILSISACVILIKGALFVASLRPGAGGQLLAHMFPATKLASKAWETLWLASVWFLAFGTLLTLAVGLLAWFRVDLLKTWSTVSNRWVSARRVAKPAATPYFGFDRWVGTRPRLWGGVIALFALYSMVVLVGLARALP